jgi:hypothetical protein
MRSLLSATAIAIALLAQPAAAREPRVEVCGQSVELPRQGWRVLYGDWLQPDGRKVCGGAVLPNKLGPVTGTYIGSAGMRYRVTGTLSEAGYQLRDDKAWLYWFGSDGSAVFHSNAGWRNGDFFYPANRDFED